MNTSRGLSRAHSRGFVPLVLLVVVGIAVLGGAGWWVTQKEQGKDIATTTPSTNTAEERTDESGTTKTSTSPQTFTATPLTGRVPLTVTFTASSAGDVSIDYGDGEGQSTACDGAPKRLCLSTKYGNAMGVHIYTKPGVYTASASGHLPSRNLGTLPITVSPNASSQNTKVYRNEKYGFEYQYPANLVAEENRRDGSIVAFVLPGANSERVTTKIYFQEKEFSEYGPIRSVADLTQALEKRYESLLVDVAVVEQGGFSVVIADGPGIPGYAGPEPDAYILLDEGILHIYPGEISGLKKIGTPDKAAFNASPLSGKAPLAVTFTYVQLSPAFLHSLDFGDGSSGQMSNITTSGCVGECPQTWRATHTYASSGTYTARLTKTCGTTETCTAQKWEVGTAIITAN